MCEILSCAWEPVTGMGKRHINYNEKSDIKIEVYVHFVQIKPYHYIGIPIPVNALGSMRSKIIMVSY